MMTRRTPAIPAVLAIDPTTKGFAYIFLEGGSFLVDWGTITVKGHDQRDCLRHVSRLISFLHPDVLVLEDARGNGSRRCERVCIVISEMVHFANDRDVAASFVSRGELREAFGSRTTTKHAIATELVKLFPELQSRFPRFRKPWMTEDERMNIFDALSLAWTYLKREKESRGVEAG